MDHVIFFVDIENKTSFNSVFLVQVVQLIYNLYNEPFLTEILVWRVSTQAVLLVNSSIRFFWPKPYVWYITFGLNEFSSKTASEISQKFANKG